MEKNTGKKYELFVADLYNAILFSEQIGEQKNIKVEVDKHLTGLNGVSRQFDIYWEYEFGGITYRNIIECKDYQSKITIDRIDGLVGKLRDFPNLRGVIATKSGYQSGAEIKAKADGIELLRVREQNDSDWIDKEGTPFIKEAQINMTVSRPALIRNINFSAESEWTVQGYLNNEVFITHLDSGQRYSLFDLQEILTQDHEQGFGEFTKKFNFDGELSSPNDTLRIKGYTVKYEIQKPHTKTLTLAFYKSLIGVVEYLTQGRKAKIFDDGRVLKEDI